MNSAQLPTGPGLASSIERARARAASRRHVFFGPEGVLEVLLEERGEIAASRVLSEHLDRQSRAQFVPAIVEPRASLATVAMAQARARAEARGGVEVDVEDLIAELVGPGSPLDQELLDRVRGRLDSRIAPNDDTDSQRDPDREPALATEGPTVGGASSRSLLHLMTAEPGDERLIERTNETRRLLQTLLLSSVVVVGSPGSGRRSLLRLVARAAGIEPLPRPLAGARFVVLDGLQLVAGTAYRGELEARMQGLVRELEAMPGVPILVVDSVATMFAGGGSGDVDLAGVLLPLLRRSRIRLLTVATESEVRERMEKRPELLDELHLFHLAVPTIEECDNMLVRIPATLAEILDVEIEPLAIRAAIRSCAEELPQCALPGAAVRVIEHAASSRALARSAAGNGGSAPSRVVTVQDVLRALSDLHGIPQEHLEADTPTRIKGFAEAYDDHIFGQAQAFAAFDGCLTTALMKLCDPLRPRGRMFLVGPPGTGKTESARLLARYLMGRDEALLRLDMSEFQGESSVSTLIGSDKGLVGSDDGGRLTEPLRMNPHRVVLVDEIEKAHPAVYRLFLQILDNGEIQDKRGRRISFRHAIVIFTSNAGCDPERGLGTNDRAEIVRKLEAQFSHEFLNRIETFVAFEPHTPDSRDRVAAFQLRRFAEQLRAVHGCELDWAPGVQALAARPPAREAGARHVLRWVTEHARAAVATWLARNAAPTGVEGRSLRLGVGPDGEVFVHDHFVQEGSENHPPHPLEKKEGAIPLPTEHTEAV